METPDNGNPLPFNGNPLSLMETIFEKTRNYHLWKPFL
jgi:hypothetical protein